MTNEDKLFAIFGSILYRINEKRNEQNKITITDLEKYKAIKSFLKDNPDLKIEGFD